MFGLVANVVVVVVVDVDGFPAIGGPVVPAFLVSRGDWAFRTVLKVVIGGAFSANLAAVFGVVGFEMTGVVAPFALFVASKAALYVGEVSDMDLAIGQELDVHLAEAEVGGSNGDLEAVDVIQDVLGVVFEGVPSVGELVGY